MPAYTGKLPTWRDKLSGSCLRSKNRPAGAALSTGAEKEKTLMASRDIAVVIHDGVQALDVAGPLDVFAAANGFLPEDERYRCLLVAGDTAPVRSSNGMWMTPDLSFEEASRRFDTVLVAGGPGLPDRQADETMSEWLRDWGVLATIWLDLQRHIRAWACRSSRRPDSDHPLVMLGGAGGKIPDRACRARPDLCARRSPRDIGRRDGRH
jgi:hypothetical protein